MTWNYGNAIAGKKEHPMTDRAERHPIAQLFCRLGVHTPPFTSGRAYYCVTCGKFLGWTGV